MNEKRLEELQGEQIRLQAQCYQLLKALEATERQLELVAAALGEHTQEPKKTPEKE